MAALKFDENEARKLRAAYSTADVQAQRRWTIERLALSPGESVIDAGCGPGFLCEEMADAVGPQGRVLGIDRSDDLLAFARGKNTRGWLAYDKGDVLALEVADGAFDVGVSVQVLEYVGDVGGALAELYRVLRPGGRALVMDTDWSGVAWPASEPAFADRITAAWDRHCVDSRVPRTLAFRLRAAGFTIREVSGYPIIDITGAPDGYSRSVIALVVDFILKENLFPRAEVDAWLAEIDALSAQGRYFFSLQRTMFFVAKPAAAD
jgi:arsenite methyltransferase